MSGRLCGLAVFLRVGGGKLEWEHRVIACRCCCASLFFRPHRIAAYWLSGVGCVACSRHGG
eukprot:7801978-Alexandrium_andersonii.AAC.1